MTDQPLHSVEDRVVVLAPTRKDAAMCSTILSEAGIGCVICSDLPQVCREVRAGVAAVLLTEESLVKADVGALIDVLAAQPHWSDLPLLILTRGGAQSPLAAWAMQHLGNVMLLERPVQRLTLISALRASLKARRRQYVLQEYLAERNRTEEALRESENRLGLAISATNLGTWDHNLVAGTDNWDARFKGLLGLPADMQASYDAFLAALHPEDRERTHQAVQRTFDPAGGGVFDTEYRTAKLHDNGEVRWIHATGRAFFDDAGNVTRFTGTVQDITTLKMARSLIEQHTAELESRVAERTAELAAAGEKVRAERQLFLDLLETLPVVVTLLRPDHHVQWVNRAYREALGDNVGQLCYASQFGRENPCEECQAFIPLTTGRPHHWEWTLPNGRTFDIYNFPFVDADGSPLILEMDIDITERRQAEVALRELNENLERRVDQRTDALRQSESRYRRLMQAIPVPLGVVSKNGQIVHFNDRFTRVFGYAQADIPTLDAWWQRAYPDPAYRRRVIENWQAKMRRSEEAGTETDPEEFNVTCKDGSVRVVVISNLAIDDCILAAFIDITDRKRAEEAITTAKAAAEAASEAKSQFLANMSHELRTPMNAILGMIDVALPKADHPTVRDCLQTAKGSADLLLTLLNDLLDSAKIESGKLELESVPFSLRRMLDQLTRVLAVRASEKGLTFYCRLPDETPDAVVGDRMRLQQVLLNLASNAIKFTERGEVEIALRTLSHYGEAHLEFAVRDTGIGIPASGLDRLFQPFTQADASMSRRFGGTGLGLTISKSLVEMMGGRIWAVSDVGVGSTFYFTVRLPLTKELPVDFEAPVAVPAAACAQLRILLVEDNPANQKLATYVLQDRGHLVEIAGEGQEAVYLTERNRYDVILMDVQMPGMSGLEATAEIRKHESGNRRVPIIAMTAHAMKGDRERCLAGGMDGYLSKPINAAKMIDLVERLAAVGPAAGAVSSPAKSSLAAESPAAPVFDPELALKRREAEHRLHMGNVRSAFALAETDARALVHELQVYQIELEMQNEELHRARAAAEEASTRYSDLFDFAPVAYFLWDHAGRILEVNLRGASLLGLDRSMVVHKRFGHFVAADFRDQFADFCSRVLATDTKQTCEIKILKEGRTVDVLVESIATQDRPGQERHCRASVIEISQQKRVNKLVTEATGGGGVVVSSPAPADPANTAAAPPFDPELALKRCLGKPNVLAQMIHFFFDDVDTLLPQIRAALQRGDLADVGKLGHRLKGTIAHLAAEPAKEAATRLEQLALHGGQHAEAEEAVRAIEQQCEVLRAALTEYHATTSPMQGGQ